MFSVPDSGTNAPMSKPGTSFWIVAIRLLMGYNSISICTVNMRHLIIYEIEQLPPLTPRGICQWLFLLFIDLLLRIYSSLSSHERNSDYLRLGTTAYRVRVSASVKSVARLKVFFSRQG